MWRKFCLLANENNKSVHVVSKTYEPVSIANIFFEICNIQHLVCMHDCKSAVILQQHKVDLDKNSVLSHKKLQWFNLSM